MSGLRRTVLVVDDHALVRSGIRSLVNSFAGFEVIGEAADGRQAVAMARQLAPDVVLLDISMPELDGLEAGERITRLLPESKVLVLSMHATEHHVRQALARGVAGYVIKDVAPETLEHALNSVAAGQRYLSPPLSSNLLAADLMRQDEGDRISTGRQREILQLIAEGRSSREIAERLHISVKTVETHRAQLMQRLEIYDVAGLTRYAIRTGLVSADLE